MEPVGGSRRIRVDVRVVAATNKNLQVEIAAGRFREDLFFRLNVVPITVTPLRERATDIPLLAQYFMATLSREYGRKAKLFEPDAVEALQRYPWPGNVRELRNVVERVLIMVPGGRVTAEDLPLAARPAPDASAAPAEAASEAAAYLPLHDARDAFERRYIQQALSRQRGHISRTADVLGVERSNLYRKMRALGIPIGRRDDEPL